MVSTSQNHQDRKSPEQFEGVSFSGRFLRLDTGFSLDDTWDYPGVSEASFIDADAGALEEFAICEVKREIPETADVPWVRVLRRAFKSREIAEANVQSHRASSAEFIIEILSHSELEEIRAENGIIVKSKAGK